MDQYNKEYRVISRSAFQDKDSNGRKFIQYVTLYSIREECRMNILEERGLRRIHKTLSSVKPDAQGA